VEGLVVEGVRRGVGETDSARRVATIRNESMCGENFVGGVRSPVGNRGTWGTNKSTLLGV